MATGKWQLAIGDDNDSGDDNGNDSGDGEWRTVWD